MTYDISRRVIPDQRILSIRDRLVQSELPAFLGRSFGELFGHLRLLGVEPQGEPFVIYHAFGWDDTDLEVCVPIAAEVVASGRITARLLPGESVAQTLHVGPYDELATAYAAVTAWIRRNGFEVAGPVRERYLNGPADAVSPTAYRTILEMPIVEAAVLAR
jgi:effector-binding domain-containing protein